jgi:predicted permease
MRTQAVYRGASVKPHLWFIQFIGLIVPRRLRAGWRQEWEAELRHREMLLAEWERLDWRAKFDLLGRSTSAFWDALWLQPRRWEDEMFQDLRYGMRMLLKNPGFTVVAVLTLALGIGANTAIFSVINGVLLEPLPYDQPGQLVQLWEAPRPGRPNGAVSPGAFTDWKEGNTTLEVLSLINGAEMNLAGEGQPETIRGLMVSASYLQILRLQPALGRGFSSDEDRPGSDNKVVVIAHELWQRRFGADPSIIGRAIRLNSEPHSVIGVLPPEAALPGWPIQGEDRQFLIPFAFEPDVSPTTRQDHRYVVIARLKPAVTLEQAQAELTSIKQRLQSLYPKWKEHWSVMAVPLHEQITGKMKPALLVLMGAVGFVLLIACANVANLLLAKAASRQKEMAIRAALGASRRRVIRQVLTESSLLALLGGVLGVVLAYWGVQALSQWSGATLPRAGEIALDARVLVFSLLASVATGLLFGLIPALQVSTPKLNHMLKEGGRSSTRGLQDRVRGGLIVAEVALALTLLAGAGLLVRSFVGLLNVDPGFNPRNTLAMDISVPPARYPSDDDRARFFQQICERLEALPGVEAAGMASNLPMLGWSSDTNVKVLGRPNQPDPGYSARYNSAAGNYFSAQGIPLLRGRDFSARDNSRSAPPVIVVTEALVKKIFPNEDPLGKRLRFWNFQGRDLDWEIVGVVGNVRQRQLDDDRMDRLYLPSAFIPSGRGSLVVRTMGPPLALAEAIRQEILALDPEQPVSNIRTMEQAISRSLTDRRFMLTLLGIFAGAALGLAAIGLYGMMAYTVTQRSHEIGIRMALGAQRRDVLRLIVGQGLKLVLLGLGLGLMGALAVTRFLEASLFGVTPTDPLTFAVIAVFLTAVALLACWIPARRATKVDPLVALRHE